MFDTYQVGPRSLNANVSVTENRAPPDESVRLLREMEQKAEREILQAVRLDGNEFKGVMHKTYDPMTDEDRYAVIFELNGKRYKIIESCQRGETMEKFVQRLRDAVANELSRAIIIPLSMKMHKV